MNKVPNKVEHLQISVVFSDLSVLCMEFRQFVTQLN